MRTSSTGAGGVIVLEAPAKVNLHLGIHAGLDERGYHKADSLMVALDLCDYVRIERADKLSVSCVPALDLLPEQNIAWKAAVALAQTFKREAHVAISIEKKLPKEAGLGGGSSDAAAVLKGLCELWNIDIDDARVYEVAKKLGADVPFFLDTHPKLLAGAGDVVVRQLSAPSLWLVLVRPQGAGVSTKEAYATYDASPQEPPTPDSLVAAIEAGELTAIAKLLYNNLEEAACKLVPAVSEVLSALRSSEDVLSAQVCGSGSCCFALCEDEAAAKRVEAMLAGSGWWVCVTRTRN